MTTHTIEKDAWLTEHSYATPDELIKGKGLGSISFSDVGQTMETCGWSRVGTATVTVTLLDKGAMVDAKVSALEAELQKTLADAEFAATRIRGQIQSLLAITNEVSA